MRSPQNSDNTLPRQNVGRSAFHPVASPGPRAESPMCSGPEKRRVGRSPGEGHTKEGREAAPGEEQRQSNAFPLISGPMGQRPEPLAEGPWKTIKALEGLCPRRCGCPGPYVSSLESQGGRKPRLFSSEVARPGPETARETGRPHSPWLRLGSAASTESAAHPSPKAAASSHASTRRPSGPRRRRTQTAPPAARQETRQPGRQRAGKLS